MHESKTNGKTESWPTYSRLEVKYQPDAKRANERRVCAKQWNGTCLPLCPCGIKCLESTPLAPQEMCKRLKVKGRQEEWAREWLPGI